MRNERKVGKSSKVQKEEQKVERNATEVDRKLYLVLDPSVNFTWFSTDFIGNCWKLFRDGK
jgi:hypothetical protein